MIWAEMCKAYGAILGSLSLVLGFLRRYECLLAGCNPPIKEQFLTVPDWLFSVIQEIKPKTKKKEDFSFFLFQASKKELSERTHNNFC